MQMNHLNGGKWQKFEMTLDESEKRKCQSRTSFEHLQDKNHD